MSRELHKPIIETLINTAALALTSYGVAHITYNEAFSHHLHGYASIGFGMALEFYKYYGRKINLW